ncbi:methylitaconate delta2-delta3-isomerase [Pseudozyma hubeiensis SY62]|uniref:Methylitaconate delta2-delta3-isomerase n=1 Tax=Pseudozyma hubeiensis (strain SY62) TaxID=1305764 RepID=R9P355_PSEHS|nr:methylitaconate delta2-delta3-isomerase [Pseudozyma hubeiensis SY62]GAC95692.1 methylitaconate delta2-delta3-isomerase [Pseudozyma hubeiensis SY62]
MQNSIDTTIYRAGTSRGIYLLANDLPSDPAHRDAALQSIMGSGHPLQIDGVGGGNSLTSKVALVSASSKSDHHDVDYLFCQVGVTERVVDTAPNCGNVMAGVGAFAVERGLVQPDLRDETCVVRVLNLNSGQLCQLSIPVRHGRVHYHDLGEKSYNRPSTRIMLRFEDTTGSCTGKLLPTSNAVDCIDRLRVSVVDAAVPVVFVRQVDVGITGQESPQELNADVELLTRLERVRIEAGRRMGLGDVSGSVIPKVSLNGPDFTPKTCHTAHAVTGAICTARAAFISGTVVSDVFADRISTAAQSALHHRISIEHPSGVLEVGLEATGKEGERMVDVVATVDRSVALIAQARVFYVVSDCFSGKAGRPVEISRRRCLQENGNRNDESSVDTK